MLGEDSGHSIRKGNISHLALFGKVEYEIATDVLYLNSDVQPVRLKVECIDR
jgi:hypothetical protein